MHSRTALHGPPLSVYKLPLTSLPSHARHMILKMASKSQGIQQLLQAEKKAETMVSDARKRKKIFLTL